MPGQSTTVGPYTVTYREPTAEILSDRAGTGAPITLGAVLEVEEAGERFVLRPSRNYYPSQDASLGAIGRFFGGEATSEVALDTSLERDLWTAVQPDLEALERPIREANRRFADADGDMQATRDRRLGRALPRQAGPGDPAAHRLPDGGVGLRRGGDRPSGRTHGAVAVCRGAGTSTQEALPARLGRDLSSA